MKAEEKIETAKKENQSTIKNIQCQGFDVLEPSEMAIVTKLLKTYVKKIDRRTSYDLLRLTLKMHERGKIFIHELGAELFLRPGVSLGAEVSHKNLYRAISSVMKKLLSEIEHYKKKHTRQHPIKKLSKKVI